MSIGTVHHRNYSGITLGITIRRQIGHDVIFRVRRGNGHHGAKIGVFYQDQYSYFVPTSITNVESEPYRILWATSVWRWKNELDDAQRSEYNRRADRGLHMTGFNLWMKEAMKGVV